MSSSSRSKTKKIKLKSSDGEIFEVEEAVATQSETLKSMMEVIPVSEVSGKTLALVIDFCKMHLDLHHHHHHHHDVPDEEADHLKDWAFRLFQVDQSAFFELVLAAHHLKIKSLEDLTCQTMADVIRGKTPQEIRKTLKIIQPSKFQPREAMIRWGENKAF